MNVVYLSGGVGGARLLDGLARAIPSTELTAIVNVGDDFEHLGLTICPDIDSVLYTLSGLGGDDTLNFVAPYWGFYVEDKWQLSPKWTLSAGVRYDLGIQTYSGNSYGSAVVDTSVPDWELKIPGRAPGLDLHYLPADRNNFAPRVSVAYEPQPGVYPFD